MFSPCCCCRLDAGCGNSFPLAGREKARRTVLWGMALPCLKPLSPVLLESEWVLGWCAWASAARGCGPEWPEVGRCVLLWRSGGYTVRSCPRCRRRERAASGQAVCVVRGRRGFGRKLAPGPVIAGERQLGAACWEPFGWVEWFGTAPRKGRPRESPRNSSRTGSPRNSTRSSSAAAGAIVN